MISLSLLVDQIRDNTDLNRVSANEQKTTPKLDGPSQVLVGRGRHQGLSVTDAVVCQQRMISRFAVQIIAPLSEFAQVRNKTFNALVGMPLEHYNKGELLFEEGNVESAEGGYVAWVDIYYVQWTWDLRNRRPVINN